MMADNEHCVENNGHFEVLPKENLKSDSEPGMMSMNNSSTFSDSDMDEVLVEAVTFTGPEARVDPGFFRGSLTDTRGKEEKDLKLPPRNQIVGATPEYIKALMEVPDKIQELRPEFTLAEVYHPKNLFCEYPRAIERYGGVESRFVDIIPNGGLKKLICKEGRGEVLRKGNHVRINYYIYVEGCQYCVESNKRSVKPYYSLLLGRKSGSIPALDLGTLTMKVREVSAFLAEPAYGYGKMGCGAWIPGNTRVLVLIEVVSKLPSPSESCCVANMTPAERRLVTFPEMVEFAQEWKAEGNKSLGKSKCARALRKYMRAASCFQEAVPSSPEEVREKTLLLHALYTNICVAASKTNQLGLVVHFGKESLALEDLPEEEKAPVYFRVAKALYMQQLPEEAKPYIDKAEELIGKEKEVRELRTYIYTMLAMEDGVKEGSPSQQSKKRRRKVSLKSIFQWQ